MFENKFWRTQQNMFGQSEENILYPNLQILIFNKKYFKNEYLVFVRLFIPMDFLQHIKKNFVKYMNSGYLITRTTCNIFWKSIGLKTYW